ncbi:FbpB family small basic protein [Niallia oryzisoli]|uniref:FbpB family small basic protein n=1 Tax=Niallia oryzisoli TaxID=1737571 RepID=A0ABZ2CEF2_9BACI
MSKRKKRSFTELVNENKLQILRNQAAIEKIEERLEKKHLSKAQ